MPDFISSFELYTVGHVFGVILGMGAAFTTDFIFLNSMKQGRLSEGAAKIMPITSKLVWIGLALIVIFGLCLFFTNPTYYLHAHKFLAKITIVLILILNGLAFHYRHLPRLANQATTLPDIFDRSTPLLMASGAISTVSWLSAFVLGSLRGLPYSYGQIMSLYLLILLVAILFSQLAHRKVFPKPQV